MNLTDDVVARLNVAGRGTFDEGKVGKRLSADCIHFLQTITTPLTDNESIVQDSENVGLRPLARKGGAI